MRIWQLSIMLFCISFLSVPGKCQQKTEKQNYENHATVNIADSQERTFHSEIYNHKIKLQIYLSMGYNESDTTFNKYPFLKKERRESYPVLYLLDSDVYFGMASVIARLLQWENKIPGIIIVGVSYGLSDWWHQRQNDYYPFPDTSLKVRGEATKYLEMCEKELIPYIESNFRADVNHRILFGHSAGGNLTLYALFSKPGLFQGYISASLSTRYLPKFFSDLEEQYLITNNDMPAKLYLSMSALEQKDGLQEWERFINVLKNRNHQNLTIKRYLVEEEGHLSSAPISLLKGIQWYFSED